MGSPSILLRPQQQRSIRQLCDAIARQRPCRRSLFTSSATFPPSTRLRTQHHDARLFQLQRRVYHPSISKQGLAQREGVPSASSVAIDIANAQKAVDAIIYKPDTIPSEKDTEAAMNSCREAAERLMSHDLYKEPAKQVLKNVTSASSVLRALEPPKPSLEPNKARETLSNLAYDLLTHPPVFITPEILTSYVKTASTLQDPTYLPEILHLYANKPVPQPDSSPIKYKSPNPKAVSQAIPSTTANEAIDTAIRSKDLLVALSVIETTFRAPAYRRSLFVRKVLPLVFGLSLTPAAAYALAHQYGKIQQVADPASATALAFVGMLTYIGVVTTTGFVAVTTANDHMDRMTWATGMALSERWFREDERAAADRVAQAWGFQDVNKKGEEEGPEWDELREWAGFRGMVLDRAELMEGMN